MCSCATARGRMKHSEQGDRYCLLVSDDCSFFSVILALCVMSCIRVLSRCACAIRPHAERCLGLHLLSCMASGPHVGLRVALEGVGDESHPFRKPMWMISADF